MTAIAKPKIPLYWGDLMNAAPENALSTKLIRHINKPPPKPYSWPIVERGVQRYGKKTEIPSLE